MLLSLKYILNSKTILQRKKQYKINNTNKLNKNTNKLKKNTNKSKKMYTNVR